MSYPLIKKTHLKLFILIILSTSFVSCNEEDIAELQRKLNENESLIKQLESERCSIQEQGEQSAILNCGSGGSFVINNGKDGSSCSVESSEKGAIVSCNDGSYVEILHGKDGDDGEDSFKCFSSEVESLGTVVNCGFEFVIDKKKSES